MFGVSLKPLWAFTNSMQVLTYLRHAETMPAHVNWMLNSIDEAINLEDLKAALIDDYSNQTDLVQTQDMARWDIDNTNLFMSFGIFTIMFISLGILHAFYYIVQLTANRLSCAR